MLQPLFMETHFYGCVSNNDLQTNSITVGQFQENVPANTHITASELMKKITMASFEKWYFPTKFDVQWSLIHFVNLGQVENT